MDADHEAALGDRPSGGLSGNEIARRLKAQQSTTRKALERLVARGIVSHVDIGRSASYELSAERAIVKQIILPLFRAEAALRLELWTDLLTVVSQLDPRPVATVLYGSVARGARAPRDLDLLIVAESSRDKERLRDALASSTSRIETAHQLSISLLLLTRSELSARADQELIVRTPRICWRSARTSAPTA